MLTILPPSCAVVMKSGNLNFLEPSGPFQTSNGTALPFYLIRCADTKNKICKALTATGQQYFTSTLLTAYRINKHFSFASHVVNEFSVTHGVPIFDSGMAPVKRHLKRNCLKGDISVHNKHIAG